MSKKDCIVGQRFGELTALMETNTKNSLNQKLWKCISDDGDVVYVSAEVLVGVKELKALTSTQHKKKSRANHCVERPWLIRHGESRTRLYRIYVDMKHRCYNPKDKFYKDYGQRGITIDERWKNYVDFSKWAKTHGYTDDLTIERIDVNGNYCPENCTWVTKREQCFNRRTNHYITYKGEKITLTELWERTGISPNTIIRYEKKGEHDYDSVIEKVLNSPYHKIHLGKRWKRGKK